MPPPTQTLLALPPAASETELRTYKCLSRSCSKNGTHLSLILTVKPSSHASWSVATSPCSALLCFDLLMNAMHDMSMHSIFANMPQGGAHRLRVHAGCVMIACIQHTFDASFAARSKHSKTTYLHFVTLHALKLFGFAAYTHAYICAM